ncbi:hypothetical protein Tco_1382820 [Tanacetum coccineum]
MVGGTTKFKDSRSLLSSRTLLLLGEVGDSGGDNGFAFSILKNKIAKAFESNAKALGSKAKASGSKAKASGSKAKASPKTLIVKSHVPIINCTLGLVNAKTWDAILNKTFGLKIPTVMTRAEEKKWKRKMGGGS